MKLDIILKQCSSLHIKEKDSLNCLEENNENTSIENTQNLKEAIPLFFQKFLKYIEFPIL